MLLTTFPIPKKDAKYSFPNRFGLPDNVFTAIVRQSQNLVFGTVGGGLIGSSYTPDASEAVIFDLLLIAPTTTIEEPLNPINGKTILFRLRQTGLGSRMVTWNSVFKFSTGIPSPTLSTTTGYLDYVEFIYNETGNRWDCIRAVTGFAP